VPESEKKKLYSPLKLQDLSDHFARNSFPVFEELIELNGEMLRWP
jgi:hypothetical protein